MSRSFPPSLLRHSYAFCYCSYRTSDSIDSSPDTIFNIAQLMRELGDNKGTECKSLPSYAAHTIHTLNPPASKRAGGAVI